MRDGEALAAKGSQVELEACEGVLVAQRTETKAEREGARPWRGDACEVHEDVEGRDEADAREVVSKVRWGILPMLWTMALICYIDRSNSAFAALDMREELDMSDASYGLGSSVFFVGYMLFEVPSNYLLVKFGAPFWMFRIVLSWGLVATGMAFITGTTSFICLRFLLGLAEAGAFPGMWYYMSLWFSEAEFGESYALLSSASAIAGIAGGLLAASILKMDGFLGFSGWRWLFLWEGLSAVVFAVVLRWKLPDAPCKATFLTSTERSWLTARQAAALRSKHDDEDSPAGVRETLLDRRVWWIGIAWALAMCGYYGILFWIPIIIHGIVGKGSSASLTSIVSIAPYGTAAIVMLANATHSRITSERRMHIFVPTFLGALSLVLVPHLTGVFLRIVVISIATAGVWALYGPLYSLPNTFLVGKGAAVGVAAINSCGSLGGFTGPLLIGLLSGQDDDNAKAFLILAVLLFLAGILMLFFPYERKQWGSWQQLTGSTHPVLVASQTDTSDSSIL